MGQPSNEVPAKRVFYLGHDQLDQFFVHQVGLGDHHQATRYLQDVKDGQVLPGLGHNAFVGSHDEQRQIDAPDSGQHVLDEALVPRYVDYADFTAAGQRHPGKAQVDRHLPLLLFREPVGIYVGQSLDQRGLPVVNVAGGADYVHVGSDLTLIRTVGVWHLM